jgi:DnaK suppressor protein
VNAVSKKKPVAKPAKASGKPAKASGKPAKASGKPATSSVKAPAKKAVSKPAHKPAGKTTAKAASKAAAKKSAAKPAIKSQAKPAGKQSIKPTAKPVKTAKTATPAKAAAVKKIQTSPVEKVKSKPTAEAAKKTSPKPGAPSAQLVVTKPQPAAERRLSTSRAGKPALVSPAPDPVRKEYVPVSAAVTAPSTDFKLPPVNPALRDAWKKKTPELLSDDEVLAMPESEYMKEVHLAFFKLRLQHMQQDLLKHADQTTENLREDTLTVPDPADRATIEEEHALELRTRDRERKLMKKIQQAIGLIDSGDYGYCEETGEPIGVRRLLARPTATLSLEAQQRRELKQKLYGD